VISKAKLLGYLGTALLLSLWLATLQGQQDRRPVQAEAQPVALQALATLPTETSTLPLPTSTPTAEVPLPVPTCTPTILATVPSPGPTSGLAFPLVYAYRPPVAQFGVDFSHWMTVPQIIAYDMPVARQMGATWARVYLSWALVEPTPGEARWELFDPVFEQLRRVGFNGLAVIYGWPAWATTVSCGPIAEEHLPAFQAFLRAAWRRYGDVVKAWEFTNEPDNRAPTHMSPLIGCWSPYAYQYARQLELFARTLKALDPRAVIVFGGLAHDNWAAFDRNFLEATLAEGAGPWFDVVSLHYYPINGVEFPTMGHKVRRIKEILARYGLERKPIWITETAMWTNTWGGVEAQRDFIVRQFTRGLAAGVEQIYWFHVQQNPYFDESIHRWLITRLHQPDQAYSTFQYYARMLQGMSFAGLPEGLPEGVEGYRFRREGRTLYVLWANDGQEHTVLLPAEGEAHVSDRDGETGQIVAPQDGRLALTVGPKAVFVDLPAAAHPAPFPTPTATPTAVGTPPTPIPTLPAMTPTPTPQPVPEILLAQETWDLILAKIRRALTQGDGQFPTVTQGDSWNYTYNGDWTGGYWAGLLWAAYERTGEATFREAAIRAVDRLAERQHDTSCHDIGLIFYTGVHPGYRLTGDPRYYQLCFNAAEAVLQRYNAKGGYIQAWGPIGDPQLGGRTIVDTMVVLPIFWWAQGERSDDRYALAAINHTSMTAAYHVRRDGSVAQVCDLDPETGALLRRTTSQGYSDDSCWSRGQAWAIYGFAIAARRTGRLTYWGTVEQVADYFLAHLPEDRVPYWDFLLPSFEGEPKDSSAAAIAAAGLLELGEAHPDGAKRARYRQAALEILASLTRNYLNRDPSKDGILLHGCAHRPAGGAVDEALIWGDYYYVEALMRLWRAANR
jgi:unsaturated chondroitin disaccharide hydrolase